MLPFVRVGFAAALVALAFSPVFAADKAFENQDLSDAGIKLEAQIKTDAGQVTKPLATLRKDADAAFQKNDFRSGMVVLAQMAAVAPDDALSYVQCVRCAWHFMAPKSRCGGPPLLPKIVTFIGPALALLTRQDQISSRIAAVAQW